MSNQSFTQTIGKIHEFYEIMESPSKHELRLRRPVFGKAQYDFIPYGEENNMVEIGSDEFSSVSFHGSVGLHTIKNFLFTGTVVFVPPHQGTEPPFPRAGYLYDLDRIWNFVVDNNVGAKYSLLFSGGIYSGFRIQITHYRNPLQAAINRIKSIKPDKAEIDIEKIIDRARMKGEMKKSDIVTGRADVAFELFAGKENRIAESENYPATFRKWRQKIDTPGGNKTKPHE